MLPIISGGHSAYQDKFMSDFATFYPDPYSISKETWDTIIEFYHLVISMSNNINWVEKNLIKVISKVK